MILRDRVFVSRIVGHAIFIADVPLAGDSPFNLPLNFFESFVSRADRRSRAESRRG